MIISARPAALSIGEMRIKNHNVGGAGAVGAKLSISSSGFSQTEAAAPALKTSVYGSFEKEMSRRLAEASKKNVPNGDEAADHKILLQSLTGAMGEIEEIFGRESAIEAMAKILNGTEKELSEDSLLSSIQSSLGGLRRLDPNETKLKLLTEGFNKDLALFLDPELAAQKLQSQETMSLSYAIASHFGSAAAAGTKESRQAEAVGVGAEDSEPANAAPESGQAAPRSDARASYEMMGFDATGRWDAVEVSELDEASAEELKEKAEAGINRATVLTMADIMKTGGDAQLFQNLAYFLEKELQDKESAAFLEQGIADSQLMLVNEYGSSPEMAKMLSQVYSKVAADGDADKLSLLESYINTDFKDALNPILAEMQRGDDAALRASADIGELQFKGINGASLAGENDKFSLGWGYKGASAYDQVTSKRFLQEDIRGVKAVQEKKDEAELDDQVRRREESAIGRIAREGREAGARGKAPSDGAPAGLDAGEKSQSEALREEFAAKRRQGKLEEAMGAKFGQLSDGAREELEQHLRDNFADEDAERLLEHTKWSNDLMSGLAAIYGDIQESGDDGGDKAEDFMRFLNGNIKKEIEGIADELGGMSFDGWQPADGLAGALKAVFSFAGQEKSVGVTCARPAKPADQGPVEAMANQPPAAVPQAMQKLKSVGYLIDLQA